MTIEVATTINQLDHNLPDFQDFVSEGDDHIRLLKSSVKNTFHNVLGVVNASHTELNFLVGVTTAVLGAGSLAALPGPVGGTTPVASIWTDLTATGKVRASSNGTVGLATDLHAVGIGPVAGLNIAIGNGVVQARNNGAIASLILNSLGGIVSLGSAADTTSTVDLKNARVRVQATTPLALQIQNMLDGAPAITAPIEVNLGMYSSSGTRRMFLGFGTSVDLAMQNDSWAGSVKLQGNNGAGAARLMAQFQQGGAVFLAYDNSFRFATTAVGAAVTGTMQMDQITTLGNGNNVLDGQWLFGGISSIQARPVATSSLSQHMGLQVGPTAGVNLGFGVSGLQARNNAVVSPVSINPEGGDVQIGRSDGGRVYWNDTSKVLVVDAGASLQITGNLLVSGTSVHTFLGTINAVNVQRNGINLVDSSRSVNTALGLQGGGQLTADRTIDYALQNLSATPQIDVGDLFLTRDISANIHTSTTLAKIKEFRSVQRTSNAVLDGTDAFTEQVWASSGAGSLTLPASTFEGNRIKFRKGGTGNLTILGYTVKKGSYDTIVQQGGTAEAVAEGGIWYLSGDLGDTLTNGFFESSAVAVTASGSFTHGLGAKPDGFSILLTCTSAIFGYVVGDEIKLESLFDSGGNPTVWSNATQIGWAMQDTGPTLFQKGTSTPGTVAGSWSIVGRAWRYRS